MQESLFSSSMALENAKQVRATLSVAHENDSASFSFFLHAVQEQKMFSFATRSMHLAVTSFSGDLSISGPDNVLSVVVEGLVVVSGDVLKKVEPWKFLTVRFVNRYESPFFKVDNSGSHMWSMEVPVSSSRTQSSLTLPACPDDFSKTSLGLSFPMDREPLMLTLWFCCKFFTSDILTVMEEIDAPEVSGFACSVYAKGTSAESA